MSDDYRKLIDTKFEYIKTQMDRIEGMLVNKIKEYNRACKRIDNHELRLNLIYAFIFGGIGLAGSVLFILKIFKVI